MERTDTHEHTTYIIKKTLQLNNNGKNGFSRWLAQPNRTQFTH